MAIIDDVKLALRISGTTYDNELNDLIAAAKADLSYSGIDAAKVDNLGVMDPLIKRAIVLYCKSNFGLDNADSEKYYNCYRQLETHLALSEDYQLVVV